MSKLNITVPAILASLLFAGSAMAAPLQPAAGDEIRGTGVLRHVERVLVAHVDDARADLDPLRARADGGQQREGRAELAREMVHAEIGAIKADLLGLDGQVDGLLQHIRRAAHLRAARGRPVTE